MLFGLLLWGISYWRDLSSTMVSSIRFAALLLPFLSISKLHRSAFQGMKRIKASIVPMDLIQPFIMITGIYLFSLEDVYSAFNFYIIVALIVCFIGIVWLCHCFPTEFRSVSPEFQTRIWMFVTLPMLFGGIAQIVMNRTDVLMLGTMTDMKTVGLYTASNRIANLNTFALGSINTIAAPMLADAFHDQRIMQFKIIMRKAILWSTSGALPFFMAMIFSPEILLSCFGSEFKQGATLLMVLGCGQFINAVSGPVGFALLMTGNERTYALITTTVAVGNVIGNFITIPIWGATGAAVITAFSVIVLNSTLFLQLAKYTKKFKCNCEV
jgi:O-antigen/teichoic acid export membrane protein